MAHGPSFSFTRCLSTSESHAIPFTKCDPWLIHPDDVDQRPATTSLAFHPLFYYLHFTAGAELDPTAVLHTLLPTHPDCRRKLYAPLSGHASAACAFVTSPPVRSITLLHPDSESIIASVRNPDGCTVLDVNRLLGDMYVLRFFPCDLCSLTDGWWGHDRKSRRLPRSLANMRAVLSHYQTLLNDYRRTPGGSFADIMCGAPHRGFLEDHRFVVDPTYGCGVTLSLTFISGQVPLP
jgi:hypothetical protein